MAVDPDHRREGIGSSLLKEMLASLERLGAHTAYLSVSEDNISARKLYEKFKFEITKKREDYFGKNEDRLILRRALTPESPGALSPNKLMSEAGTSVSFSSTMFAISAAVLALVVPRTDVDKFSIPLLLVTLAMFASFYSALFYANASGASSRIHDNATATKPLQYGNAVSEYLGVYPLVCAFPLLIHHITNATTITLLVAIINYLGFILYQFSGFDLLSRIYVRQISHLLVTVLLVLMMTGMLATTLSGNECALYLTVALFLTFTVYLTALGVRRAEISSA